MPYNNNNCKPSLAQGLGRASPEELERITALITTTLKPLVSETTSLCVVEITRTIRERASFRRYRTY